MDRRTKIAQKFLNDLRHLLVVFDCLPSRLDPNQLFLPETSSGGPESIRMSEKTLTNCWLRLQRNSVMIGIRLLGAGEVPVKAGHSNESPFVD